MINFKGKLVAYNVMENTVEVYDGKLSVVKWLLHLMEYRGTDDTDAEDVEVIYIASAEKRRQYINRAKKATAAYKKYTNAPDWGFHALADISSGGFSKRCPGNAMTFLGALADMGGDVG